MSCCVFSLKGKKNRYLGETLISEDFVLQQDKREEKATGKTNCIPDNCGRNMKFPNGGQLSPWEANFKGVCVFK